MAKTAKQPKKSRLADLIAAAPRGVRPGPHGFFGRLSQDEQAELIEIKRRWMAQSDGYAGRSAMNVFTHVKQAFNLTVAASTFTRWLGESND